jgi:hypothetical protein
LVHKPFPSVCVFLCVSHLSLQGNGYVNFIPPFGARQQLGKHVPAARNTHNNRRIVGRVIFCAAHVLSKECLCILLSLLGSKSVKTFPRQRRIAGVVVFYAVPIVWKRGRD